MDRISRTVMSAAHGCADISTHLDACLAQLVGLIFRLLLLRLDPFSLASSLRVAVDHTLLARSTLGRRDDILHDVWLHPVDLCEMLALLDDFLRDSVAAVPINFAS